MLMDAAGYRESLRAYQPRVFVGGQRVESVADEPLLLPGINGIEAFRQIRGNAATKSIPVVALTASVTPTDRSAINAAGFDAFLSKPINLKEFLDTVKRLIETKGK